MASVTNLHPDTAPEGGGLYIGPVPEDRRRSALALLLIGRPREQDAAVDHFERFASEQGLDLSTLWVASHGDEQGRMLGSALLVPNHGSTAMLFLGQATGWSEHSAVVKLIKAVCDGPGRQGVAVVQSLIDPGQVVEGQVLARRNENDIDLSWAENKVSFFSLTSSSPPIVADVSHFFLVDQCLFDY